MFQAGKQMADFELGLDGRRYGVCEFLVTDKNRAADTSFRNNELLVLATIAAVDAHHAPILPAGLDVSHRQEVNAGDFEPGRRRCARVSAFASQKIHHCRVSLLHCRRP